VIGAAEPAVLIVEDVNEIRRRRLLLVSNGIECNSLPVTPIVLGCDLPFI
jgi:hypothetical protein